MKQFNNYLHFDRLDKLVNQNRLGQQEDCLWMYFDIKDGIDGRVLKSKLDHRKISIGVLQWICTKIDCEVDDIEEQKLDGFGNRVVQSFLSDPEALSGYHKFVRTDYWSLVFGDFFEKLLWFFAAPKSSRT